MAGGPLTCCCSARSPNRCSTSGGRSRGLSLGVMPAQRRGCENTAVAGGFANWSTIVRAVSICREVLVV